MSGINSVGDVKLDGNPNTFTGTNTFDTNLPTSTITSASTNDFITKAIGDNLYTSSVGDALLAGGTSESNPQIFTGFNFFNEVTKFEDEIYVQDKIVMDGGGSGATPTALILQYDNNKNIIKQDDASLGGNCIYQISDPLTPLEVPVENACVFHQTGTKDIIRTEGKVQMLKSPDISVDCVNFEHFVDYAARLAEDNTFTGTNQFNTLPTSNITTATSQANFITKAIGDSLYGGAARRTTDNTFSGTNTFNGSTEFNTLPTSNIATATSTQFITKAIGDSLYGGPFRGFEVRLPTTFSGVTATPWIFSNVGNVSLNSYNRSTGYFTATADDVGYWMFSCEARVSTSDTQEARLNIRKRANSSSSTQILATSVDNQGKGRGGTTAYGFTTVSCIIELEQNNQIYMSTDSTVNFFFPTSNTRFFGFKIAPKI